MRFFMGGGGFEPCMGILVSHKPWSPWKIVVLIIIAPKMVAQASSPRFNTEALFGGPHSFLHLLAQTQWDI